MRTLDAQGRSIDEAIFNGLKELGVSIDEVEIDILQQETKGVLGIGAKPAIVRLIEREPEQIVIPDYLSDADRMRSGNRSGARRDDHSRGDRRGDRNRGGRRDDRRSFSRDDAPAPAPAAPAAEAAENAATEVIPSETAASTEGAPHRNDGNRGGRNDRNRNDRSRGDRSRGDRSRGDRSRDDRNRNGRGNGPRASRYEADDVVYPPAEEKPEVIYSAEAAVDLDAAKFLKELLMKMGVEAEILANVSEDGVKLRIDTNEMGILIGHRGETLDSIQYLTSLHVNRTRKENGYTRVTIDTEDYREKREETLTRLARKVAAQVRSTGRARAMEPMNPYERRVLHATLQANPYVTTFSEGEEPNRRVVIAPKAKEAANAESEE